MALVLFMAFFLQLIALESANGPERSITLDIPFDFNNPVKVYDDFVRIIGVPLQAEAEFNIVLSYRTKGRRHLSLEISSIGIENRQKTEFRYVAVIAHRTEETQTLSIKVALPDSLVYLADKALNIISDLYIEELHVTAQLEEVLDGGLASQPDSEPVFLQDFMQLPLVAPWSRPRKPGYSFPWPLKYLRDLKQQKIEKCHNLHDIVDLLVFPVALAGKDTGVKRILSPLAWPREELAAAHSRAKPRFTISTWIFILEPCFEGFCGIFSHRSSVLLTPLLSITSDGFLHVQMHYKDNTANAFVVNSRLPLKKWVEIVMSVDDTTVYVTTRFYHNQVLEKEENAVHRDSPQGSFHYDDTEGYWLLGATDGAASFKGIIGHTRIYRRHLFFPGQVSAPLKHDLMFRIDVGDYLVTCSETIVSLHETVLVEEELSQRTRESSVARRRSLMELVTNSNTPRPQCLVTLSGGTPEVDSIVKPIMRQYHNNLNMAADSLFSTGNKKLVASVNDASTALGVLQVSSCMGHARSLYTIGVMHMLGLGVFQDRTQGWKYLLLGAANGDALCQMALAYRHLLGADGVQDDCDIALGYYKAAARTSDKLLQQHQEVATHSEAVRLDDYDELVNHKGNDSDVFQWLTHQALHGWSDAQSLLADMYYFGKRGIQRDLNRAVRYYQMGAENGDPGDLYNLGVSKLKGHGVEKNETEAIELFKLSAEQNFPPALNALGFYEAYMRQNHSGATVFFKRAADLGDRDGLQNLAVAYDNGWVEGHPPDKITAFNYWFEAASKGHPGSCITVGEGVSNGQYVKKNCPLGVVYLRYVAEQNPDVGWFLRRGLEAYYEGNIYKSLVNFLLAGEVGMEVPLYNAALLCEENKEELAGVASVDCIWHCYNRSAAMGWVFAMIKVGDNHWYGKTVQQNITAAAEMYAQAADKNDFPQALYNLAYMVEYNYTLVGIHWSEVDKHDVLQGNLTFAASLYAKCRDSQENNNESFLPCAFGVVRVKLKLFWEQNTNLAQAGVVLLTTAFLGLITLWIFLPNDNGF